MDAVINDVDTIMAGVHTDNNHDSINHVIVKDDFNNSSTRSDDDDDDDEPDDDQRMVQSTTSSQYDTTKESRTVLKLKLTVITILVLSALAVGIGTFVYLNQSEQHKFHDTFYDDATKVGQSIYSGVITTFGALDILATTAVTAAIVTNETWPYTTIPFFANHAAKALSMSAGFLVNTIMLLHNKSERIQWEQYSWDHRYTVNETLHIMAQDPNYVGTVPWNVTMDKSLQADTDTVPYNESRLFAPIWQSYPIPVEGSAFNWDWLTDENIDSLLLSYQYERAVVGEPYILPDPSSNWVVLTG